MINQIVENKSLELNSNITEKCNEAILISGSARSGTTIMGKIIFSLNNVEYCFEPPLLFSLFSLISKLNKNDWKLLYETYLFEEILINSLAGRGLNCNKEDDSSAYTAKSNSIIENRLKKTKRKEDLVSLALQHQIAFKMPDIVLYIPKLMQFYPKTRVVIMIRKADQVLNSILKKGWFKTKTLREGTVIYPNRCLEGVTIPYWVEEDREADWLEWDELNRAAYYYIRANQGVENLRENLLIKYDEFIEHPFAVIEKLAARLSLSFGEKTELILKSVKRRSKEKDPNLINKVSGDLRDKVKFYSSLS